MTITIFNPVSINFSVEQITEDRVLVIPNTRQMLVHGIPLTINGTIILEGALTLRE